MDGNSPTHACTHTTATTTKHKLFVSASPGCERAPGSALNQATSHTLKILVPDDRYGEGVAVPHLRCAMRDACTGTVQNTTRQAGLLSLERKFGDRAPDPTGQAEIEGRREWKA